MSQTTQATTKAAPRRKLRPRSRLGEFLNRLTVRKRLIVLVGVFGVGWIATVGVAVFGLVSGRHSFTQATVGFDAYGAEQSGYAGWLAEDDPGEHGGRSLKGPHRRAGYRRRPRVYDARHRRDSRRPAAPGSAAAIRQQREDLKPDPGGF